MNDVVIAYIFIILFLALIRWYGYHTALAILVRFKELVLVK